MEKVKKEAPFLMLTEQLTLEAAIQLTNLAREKASVLGKHVSVAVLDAGGQIIILSRGDGVGIHNTEAARRKAFTAASTKTSTLILSRNARSNPDTENLASLPELLLLGGGVPLYHNGKVIGAIGIAGGGSPENDDLIGRSANSSFNK
ncbi:MAG: heme-binding protein [Bacteroidia bacterium]